MVTGQPGNGRAGPCPSYQELDSPEDAMGTIKRAPFLGPLPTEPPAEEPLSSPPGESQAWETRRQPQGGGCSRKLQRACACRNPAPTSFRPQQRPTAAHGLGHHEAAGGS